MKKILPAESFIKPNYNPAPNAYNNTTDTKKTSPNYGFGSSTRKELKKLEVPGPGAYRVPSSIGDVPSYAIPGRTDA